MSDGYRALAAFALGTAVELGVIAAGAPLAVYVWVLPVVLGAWALWEHRRSLN